MDSRPPNEERLPLLRLRDICLDYGRVRALDHIDLALAEAEIHAIVGEHGAGKSSLGLLLNGILKPRQGAITFAGKEYAALNITTALKLGIRMIYQQVRLYEEFSVAENLFLSDNTIKRFTWRRKRRMLEAARALLARYGFEIDPATPLQNLNLSDQTVIELLKNLTPQPRLLILDETLERLSSPALRKVMKILTDLKRAGTAIMFITHRIDDVYHFADNVSIMRNGQILLTEQVQHIDKINLIKMAYTQLSEKTAIDDLNQEFYQLLKYNEAILRNLPVNLIVTDNENRIKLVNEYCKQYFQLKTTSYLNVPVAQLLSSHHDDVQALLKRPSSVSEERMLYQAPLTLSETSFIGNIKIFPVYDGTFLIGNVLIIEDVTEYDHLQKQVMLSEKLASVGLLAAGVAHEINNPLGIISNYLSYIKYHFHDTHLHEAIDNVHEEITSIATIVSNLHTFSDNTPSRIEELDLYELIQNMLHLIKHHAASKAITIHVTRPAQEVRVTVNKNEIKQVILNLFKNSFEAMPSGGDIYIRTTSAADNGRRVVQLTFEDTGCGICDENPANIFLPFYSTKKGPDNNLGLGLSVSYGIIKKYQGSITVRNREGAGCQFLITLPASPAAGEPAEHAGE